MMDTTDVYKIWGLDKTDFYVCCFVKSACAAVRKLDTCKSPALAFNAFTSAWLDYSIMPEDSQKRCYRLVDAFREMWKQVATAKVNDFHQMLTSASQGHAPTSYDDICVSCIEMISATSFSKDIPKATQLLSDAMNLIHNEEFPNTCKALLCVLCSKILEYCLLYTTCKMTLLLEAVRYHMKSKSNPNPDYDVSLTELYANIIADAICDLSIMNMEDNKVGKEFKLFVQEGYALLSVLDTPIKEHYEEMLCSTSGISKSDALAIRRSMLQKILSKEMKN